MRGRPGWLRIAFVLSLLVFTFYSNADAAHKPKKPDLKHAKKHASKTSGHTARTKKSAHETLAKKAHGKGRLASAKSQRRGSTHVALAKEVTDTQYYVVKRGDTLSSVGKKYSLSAVELRDLNHLKSRKLKKGQKLLVKRRGPKTYVVKKGDSLEKIAKKYDMESGDLKELNELQSADVKAGQKLYLKEKVDPAVAETFHEVVPKNIDEEIKKVSQSDDFAQKGLSEKLTVFAKKMLNIPYKFGGNSILGIDCSAYVKKVYGLLGINLPRTAREQFKVNDTETIEKDNLSIGDLVFFRTYASFPSHVGIYLGNNLFIHASSRGKKVTIDSLETPYYLKRFIGGKRLITDGGTQQIDAETQAAPIGG